MKGSKIGVIVSFFALLTTIFGGFFLPQASAQVCTPLTSAPNLYEVSRTSTSATLYFTPINDQVTGYTIIYGLNPEDERYSTSFSYGSSEGAVSYTVGGLDPQQTYYFKVRANNSCGSSSPWSSWVGDSYTPSDTSLSAVGSESAVPTTKPVGGIQIPVTGPETGLSAMALPLAGIIIGFLLFKLPVKKT